MPAKRKYQPQERSVETPVLPGVLPLDRDIAVYYRQSSMKQVGNISTDMQQIDLPKYIHTLGWGKNGIILIDEDEGVSGAKRIDERKGMRRLFDMIITGKIGAVAVQAEDRLFRDETQIQVNVFIDACVKHDVRVLTPYFKYNFADKHEGPYHRLLFRMRAEQAADFLNSYIRGRLNAAKERMLIQGMWMGGNIALGYMVDDRKYLASGVPNPSWRKYELFPPCAEVVHKIFEIFIQHGGNISATVQHLFEHGPHFPNFDDPQFQQLVPSGFICAKPNRMLQRGNVYAPSRMSLVNMMTNAVYSGHWIFRDRIVVWNNHPALVPEELFFRAFNFLSPYTLDGDPNPDYSPLFFRDRSKAKNRESPRPIFKGLIGTFYEGEWRQATAAWTPSIETYSYLVGRSDLATNRHYLWSRRCDYFDQVLTEWLHAKLHATFDPEVWELVLATTADDFEAERRGLQHQLISIDQKMEALLGNFSYVQSPTLLQALEQEYANYETEKARIERKLAELERRAERQDMLMELAKHAENVLANWDNMNLNDQRSVAQAFILRIVVTPTGKRGVAKLEICWRDNSSDTFILPSRAEKWVLWTPKEIEALTGLIQEHASQIDIAAALPDRNWRAIRIKAYEIVGQRDFQISPKPIREDETYPQYLERAKKTVGKLPVNRSHWLSDELEALNELLDVGATQLQIAAALPHRSWEKIRKRITQLRGKGFKVPESGKLEANETYTDYQYRNSDGSSASTMSFLAEGNLAPR